MRRNSVVAALAGTVCVSWVASTEARGPDLFVSDVASAAKWGTAAGITSYSFAHTYCNGGDAAAGIVENTPLHPVITTSLYRVHGGRLEQIGQGFAFHEYCALQGTQCGVCGATPEICVALGAGCSSSSSASIAAGQARLASRRFINPATGEIEWPIPGFGDAGDSLYKRTQAANADLDPATHAGAQFFVETRIVAFDDAAAGNGLNNASCRALTVGPLVSGGYVLTLGGTTMQRTSAIEMWAQFDPAVQVSTAQAGAGDEVIILGSRVTDLGGGLWVYDYALENYSAAQGGGSFRVPLSGATADSQEFHDVAYHSGDPFDGADWLASIEPGVAAEWRTPQEWAENPDSNALRWGTTYSFRLIASTGPSEGEVEIGLFAPGAVEEVSVLALVPAAPPPICLGDANGDGAIDFQDITAVLSGWGASGPIGDADHDGDVDFGDVSAALGAFGLMCP